MEKNRTENNKPIANFCDRLTEQLIAKGMDQLRLSEKTGISRSAISQYCRGIILPRQKKLSAISDALDVNEVWLMGYDVPKEKERQTEQINTPEYDGKCVPILGDVPCGYPVEAEQNIQGFETVGRSDRVTYAIIAHGDSMDRAGIKDGDFVFVRQQSEVDRMDIAVVTIDGETTIKRFIDNGGDTITLLPDSTNPEHKEQVYSKKEHQITVQGKAIFTKTYLR